MRTAELPALTGIRFYAALLVYLSHIPVIPGIETFSGHHLIFNAGVVGVSFFFVLSGFILTYNYSSTFQDGVSATQYKRFVWNRFTKIYPVHLLALLMALPIQIFSPNLPLDWRAFPFHLFLVQCFWPLTQPTFFNYLNVPSWSVSCEWFFYLLAPLAIFLSLGTIRRWVLPVVAAGYAFGLGYFLAHSHPSDFDRLYLVSWFAPSRFLEFMAGIFLARVFLATPARKSPAAMALTQASGIVLIALGALYRPQAPWPFWGGLLYVPGAALLIFGLANGGTWFSSHLSRPWLLRLGMASFSFYMIHAPILRAVKGVCLHFGFEVQSWAGFGAVAVTMFVLIQSIALAVYYIYEMPVQKRLRSLLRETEPHKMPLRLKPNTSVASV